ncbi:MULTISPECIES: AraC family transcriptional regulator ligand-binding domain-containing protein [unclassified Pseudomonas]|jgi:AraC-like DNA-binding protein|uniref:AraC family transcriptional regulator ligand-binding domain-containing protein n=1 Tax=unclassified Pseudomonas TaxID=196821 RepID=UPI001913AD20|nr:MULTISPECIES: AraC family transcriptional regulator ligand-binding domain-containing protein [unclassified Pseudomonas]MBK5551968.1 AraC family transcriptional regulator ligand-binding domain-containing protein [Pseudomonas sp. TH03]MEB0226660.1 AraC family transcriptional regulator ligand-binding domain-containing protein [Pseudomonas sp. 5S1]MEB0294436.1 AraC family transcriptional regulator ligand-binding domain-containing protein [Pseudomonas sp. 10S4]WPX17837.1 AraC family transcription
MRESDRVELEPANRSNQRFHRGKLGQVLERFLDSQAQHKSADYSLVELDQLWREAARIDPAIGLKLFTLFTPQDWHVLVYLCLYSPDVASALQYWARYAPLASDADSVRLVNDENGFGVELGVDAPGELRRYVTEHYGVMFITQLQRGTGQEVCPVLAKFTHSRPSYYKQYAHSFGERIEFDCPTSCFYFDSRSLGLPMLTRHNGMLELLTQELDRRIAVYRNFSGWAAKVAAGARRALSRGEPPNLENLAKTLHQTPRTLRRRLEEQGTTFRHLLDQVRAELELHLELQGESRADIADQLGYSDLTAYLHARNRWRVKV